MSWVERIAEERLAKAAAAGDLDTPHLHGRQLDLDHERPAGWWAERFVRRERSHDRRRAAEAAVASARAGFWRAPSVDDVRERVRVANEAIVAANLTLVESDRLARFDVDDVVERWRALRR